MLATHVEKNVRDMASQIMLFVLGRLLEIGGDENLELIDKAVTEILNLMDNEC